MQITIGADPEVFIYDTKEKKYVSAAGFFPGTKKEPFKVDKGAIQVDGVALEFNIDPAKTAEEFLLNIKTVHGIMEAMVKDVNPNWVIKHEPYVLFDLDTWDKVPDDAKELGCDPDYNYTGKVNPNPADLIANFVKQKKQVPRTGSGHIHIGWAEDENPEDAAHFEDCRAASEYFWNKGYAGGYDSSASEQNRLAYYGNIGAFRPKKYGVELRSPSNVWLKSDNSIKEMFNKTKKLFDNFASGV